MQSLTPKTILKTAGLAVGVLLLAANASFAAESVDLTAQPTSVILPDGRELPMWGLFCANPSAGLTCTAMSGAAQSGSWQPPLIRVPTHTNLTIRLTNSLPGSVPTSLMIVGQLGGGLGTPAKVDSPVHVQQGATWPAQGEATDPVFTPPLQPQRIQSFGTEVPRTDPVTTTDLTWNDLKAGTYLIESGTHPSIQGPMGLYGVLIVSDSATQGYTGVTYDKDVPLLLSEIDAVQNAAVKAAVGTPGFSETAVRLLRNRVSSVSVVNGGSGYSSTDTVTISGGGGTGATAELVVEAGVIVAVNVTDGGDNYTSLPTVTVTTSTGTGADLEAAMILAGVRCSDGNTAAAACYPPAVNYDPRYYLINGIAFDNTNRAASTFDGPGATGPTGNVLLRFVNAGLRMHVPSVVGLDMHLIAEDGNVLPGTPKIQNSVFLAAGKTYDVRVQPSQATAGTYDAKTYAVFDRQLSLSTNNQRDGGMQGYIKVNGGAATSDSTASASDDNYYLVPGKTLKISDPAKGMLANDHNVYGVKVISGPTGQVTGGFKWNANGTFSYTPASGTTSASFTYQAANYPSATATVHLNACDSACMGGPPHANPDEYTSNIATRLQISPSGVLANDTDDDGYPLTAQIRPCTAVSGYTCLSSSQVTLNADGSFTASPSTAGDYNFTYRAVQSHDIPSADAAVKLHFLPASNLHVRILDGPSTLPGRTPVEITDYRWIIEEDRTFHTDPNALPTPGHCSVATGTTCTSNSGCPTGQSCVGIIPVPSLGANFHSSYMPLVAQGCVGTLACEALQTVLDTGTGQHVPAVCDVGNGECRALLDGQQEPVNPSQVHLDPAKRYYISVLPGDGANAVLQGSGGPMPVDPGNPDGPQRQFSIALDCPTIDANHDGFEDSDFAPGTGACGHGMGGAPIRAGQTAVNVTVQQTPFPTAKLSVFVFEDDNPLNGEVDAGGGVDVLATQEPGLGGFNIVLLDQAGGLGDSTGQPTYDMMNMPLSNSLAGMIDPVTGFDACPISPSSTDGLVGMIVTCPKYEAANGVATTTLSPLAGQAVIANLYPGLYEVVATPGADRTGRGEEWLQTNTLDGTKPHEAFIRPNEPSFFQEFGPAGYHVSIGFANPAVINRRRQSVCGALAPGSCSHTVTGQISSARISRAPDERIYGSGSFEALSFTQCYVSLGDDMGVDYAFTKCDPDGTFTLTGIPPGNHKITVFDQWNDIIVDGLMLPIGVPTTGNLDLHELPMMQWRTNLATRTFIDTSKDGVSQASEPGLPLVPINVRFRDGSFMGFNNTDLDGYAGFNEIFPFFNWMVLEADTTRYKQTGVHVVYDAGGPADGTGAPNGGNSTIARNIANTKETVHLPTTPNLRVPGAVYCDDGDCNGETIQIPGTSDAASSTGRIDPPWVTTEGWQGFAGHTQFFEFGKLPFEEGENGGIKGHVVYASTRPFDDPRLLLQLSWEPMVPNVTVNLYKKGTAPDGTESLTFVDTTKTTSWDEWAQGVRSDGLPNMNCPGQDPTSPFYFTLKDSTHLLHPEIALPEHSQFKCYDGMAILNQAQPAPYDGMYQFPSVTNRDPVTGVQTATNCTGCTTNPVGNGICGTSVPRTCTVGIVGQACTSNADCNPPMLPPGKYVVEMLIPPGYELVKEEDKNILLGDVYIAPVTQQFGGLGSIFILPDQAEVDEEFNASNPLNSTVNEGVQPRHEGDTGSVETFWPCVGQLRVVPDYMSLFPQAQQAAPFAGASRNLCDRKEVTLEDQSTALAKFYVFTSTHVAGHFAGVVTDDNGSEFDPFSPNYGEKFAVPNLPISFKDITGSEIARTYTDQWGFYNGLHYSTWEVNPPNPTGYGPQMAIACMNDPGRLSGGGVDPLYNPGYSNFCYEWSLMPGQTAYMDTPVVPTMAFADGYNPPDCAYPTATPAIRQVNGDGDGPWAASSGASVQSVNLTLNNRHCSVTNTLSCNSSAAVCTALGQTCLPATGSGTGYICNPSIGFTGDGSGASATATLGVDYVGVNLPGGSRYTQSPLVGFGNYCSTTQTQGCTTNANCPSGQTCLSPGGTGAVANATMRVDPLNYCGTTQTTLCALPLNAGCTAPVACNPSGLSVTSPGSGYTSLPSVSLSGGGGSGATASTFDLKVVRIDVTGGGSGYTSAPTVTVAVPSVLATAFRATATATVSGGSVTAITVTSQGSFYTGAPAVTITGGGGTGAAAVAVMGVNRLTVNPLSLGGSAYTSQPAVSFTGGGGSCSTTRTTACTSNGQCPSGQTCVLGSGAVASAFLSVNQVAVTSSGAYAHRPAVTLTPPPTGSNGLLATATATMTVNGIINLIGGSGYTAPPTVSFTNTCSGGSGAAATAQLGGGAGSHTLSIYALGDQLVPNHAYSGPQATSDPFNQKFITRHYGFGAQCVSPTASNPNCNTLSSVTIGGVPASIQSWNDQTIQVTVPSGVPACAIQQRGQPAAKCGELVITAGNGKQSIDTVTVTIGGKAPTYVMGETADKNAIQTAIDSATPGDLIMVEPGTYNELVIMWKPVRLQGVGAASVIIDGDPHPAGKVDPWRQKVLCLFGLGPDGLPGACPIQVDRVPLESIVSWNSFFNGNLAELLQEPTLMGAYEGAGITVLAKGLDFHGGDPYGIANEGIFPDGTTLLTNSAQDCDNNPANFLCNPSRIDGLTVANSSAGGGGIFAHGWNHYLEISNNRVFANQGSGSGGITIGQSEFADPNITPQAGTANPPLTTTQFPALNSVPDGTQLPYWLQTYVNVHHNSVTQNASIGDALNSRTPAGAGGVTFYTGSDYYKFNYNWVCGNLSLGDGGGVAHLGFSYNDANGGITHNSILFNQSFNPTIPTHGGGLLVSGQGPDASVFQCVDATGLGGSGRKCTGLNDTSCPAGESCQLIECGSINDVDCVPALSEGAGHGLVVDSNLIQGNSAESGSGGGIRLQLVNGAELAQFPTSPTISSTNLTPNWYRVIVQNNIIVDNVAGWDGGGVSLQDALMVDFVNNSVISNDSTASSGVLFNSFGAGLASVPPTGDPTCGSGCTVSLKQPAGLAVMKNTPNLPGSGLTCPTAQQITGVSGNGVNPDLNPYSGTGFNSCRNVSKPVIANDVFWHNRSFNIQVGALGPGTQNQQHTVTLSPALTQPQADAFSSSTSGGGLVTGGTGACATGATYWDIGARGDTGATNHSSGTTLNPRRSLLTVTTGYNSTNTSSNPAVASLYCNGARMPPENGGVGYLVPPGVAQENIPNPVFSLSPSATVDESNNWINMSYGPLSLTDYTGQVLGRYIPFSSSSPTIGFVAPANSSNTFAIAPNLDFFGNNRKTNNSVDIGAVEFPVPFGRFVRLSRSSLNFGQVAPNSASAPQNITVTNIGTTDLTVNNGFSEAAGFNHVVPDYGTDCGAGPTFTLAAGESCAFGVQFAPKTDPTAPTGGEVPYAAELIFTTNSERTVPQVVKLSGTCKAGATGVRPPFAP